MRKTGKDLVQGFRFRVVGSLLGVGLEVLERVVMGVGPAHYCLGMGRRADPSFGLALVDVGPYADWPEISIESYISKAVCTLRCLINITAFIFLVIM